MMKPVKIHDALVMIWYESTGDSDADQCIDELIEEAHIGLQLSPFEWFEYLEDVEELRKTLQSRYTEEI